LVRSSARSPNQDQRSIARVVDRLNRPLKVENLKIFNGLPDAYLNFDSFDEFSKMSLPKQQFLQWGRLRMHVQNKVDELQLNSEPATKTAILQELSQDKSDVLVLVAHNHNGILRFQPQAMPGSVLGIEQANEDTLSLSDLTSIRRETAPERTILIVSCEAGSVNSDSASFAEALLSNKLADAVISSPEPVNARDLPKILDDIAAQKTPLIRLLSPFPYHYTPIVFRMPSIKKYGDG